jgi:CubicO group peptidase (beta-lactamase class C family)
MRKAEFASSAMALLIWFLLFPAAQGQVDWSRAKPEAEGLNAETLRSMFQDLAEDPHKDLKGVVVLRHGKLVAESYFNGDTVDTLHDIRSAAKSITAILVGIAIQRHLIGSAADSIATYLPGLPRDGKEEITIRDLLNMRSGLNADDEDPSTPGNEDHLDESTDWIKTVYAVPMKTKPGANYNYCSINAFVAGAIVENAVKMPLDVFAKQTLFDPLGIGDFKWRHVPVDRISAQGNLYITTRDEARIGELVLHDGKLRGRRIVARDWIHRSVANQVPISAFDPYSDFYGYMWYSKAEPLGKRTIVVHFASGNGGNKIYVVPALDTVVAVTSSAYHHRYGQLRSQDILLKVLSAVREVGND